MTCPSCQAAQAQPKAARAMALDHSGALYSSRSDLRHTGLARPRFLW